MEQKNQTREFIADLFSHIPLQNINPAVVKQLGEDLKAIRRFSMDAEIEPLFVQKEEKYDR